MESIRLLRHDEIECRIGSISEKGLSLLLYTDARAAMKILDETFGCLHWQRSHQMIGNSLYCTVSVWDNEKQQWISKSDVGTESYTEKEKGQASDSFKRACVSVGIGRELYTAPFIWVSANKVNLDNREIVGLTIVNQNGEVVYSLGQSERTSTINRELERTGVAIDAVLNRYGVSSVDDMTEETYRSAMNSLKKTKSRVA